MVTICPLRRMALSCASSNSEQGLAHFFCQGPNVNILGFVGPSLCCNYSTLALQLEAATDNMK